MKGFNVVNATLILIGIILIVAGMRKKHPKQVVTEALGMSRSKTRGTPTAPTDGARIYVDPWTR